MNNNEVVLNLNLYDLNKTAINQLENITNFNESKQIVRDFVHSINTGTYYMLLCRDINYYTLFIKDENNEELLEDIFIECLENISSNIKSISLTDDYEAIEIWFTDKENNTIVAYFFNYDEGVIPCK